MALDGLGRRVDRLEALAGGAGVPCEKCGQTGPPLEGQAREDALRDAERRALADPHVVEADARTFPCQTCGRPRILVLKTVDNWRPFGEGQEAIR